MMNLVRKFDAVLPILFLLSLFIVWELICKLASVPTYVLPAPSNILTAFLDVSLERWLSHTLSTIKIAVYGFIISILVSIPLAIMMVRSTFLTKTMYPVLVIIQSTPVVAIAPLLIVILGTGEAPRIVITCLITFFPIVVSTTSGMLSTPPELIDLSRSLKASKVKEMWQIRLPYAIPQIFSGLKVAITLAIIGAVISEFVAADKGLGYMVQLSTSYFKIPQAFAALLLLSIISLCLFKLVHVVQKLCFGWSIEPHD